MGWFSGTIESFDCYFNSFLAFPSLGEFYPPAKLVRSFIITGIRFDLLALGLLVLSNLFDLCQKEGKFVPCIMK